LHKLDPASEAELAKLCEELGAQGKQLRAAVEMVCENPSGRRQPQHRFTQKFNHPREFIKVSKGTTVWEFKPNQWRGLFVLAEKPMANGQSARLIAFVPIRGKRFLTVDECPWH